MGPLLERLFILAALAALAALTTTCAQNVGDIDRTQPGKLRKTNLVGTLEDNTASGPLEWYYRQTVVDVPFTTGVTFIGEQSLVERMRWDISESFLTAYRTYERVAGSERPSTLPGQEYQGAPVVAFRITSHFDVIRDYNPATGEQTNVIVENTTDRPWYERDFMRVDWSENLVANFDFLAGGQGGLGVISQPASYAVTDPNDPDAPVFAVWDEVEERWFDYRDPMVWGDLERVDYFDITTKLQVTPDTFLIEYDDGTTESWPSCWFYEYGPWDCASQTIKVRASFLVVEPSAYEPLYYPDNYIARDANDEPIRTIWDNNIGGYRRCTVAVDGDFCELVRVPMFDRFGYFRTERETYDRDYGVTEEGRVYLANRFNILADELDADGELQARPIVYHLSENFPPELIPAAEEVARWWSEPLKDSVEHLTGFVEPQQMFQVVPNTYRVEDGKIVDFGQRNGDLRYNHLYWVDDPQFETLFGYGPAGVDPLTGQVIAADAYVYGAALDMWAVQGADVIDLLRGDLDVREFIDGENVGSAVAGLGGRPSTSRTQMTSRVEKMMREGLGERLEQVAKNGKKPYRRSYDYTRARLRMADGDPRFDALWNSEQQLAFERRFGRRLEPSEFSGTRLLEAIRKHRMNLAAHAVDMRMFDDGAVIALFDELQGVPRDQVILRIREYVFKSTAAHEIGHTLGLRHNFAGSTDALNYYDEYWSIRDSSAQALSLPSDAEVRAGLRERSYSSIMDYSARFASDIRGIGKYDRAAIKFGYGELVEVFDTPPDWTTQDILAYYSLEDTVLDWVHYTDLPTLFGGRANMSNRSNIGLEEEVAWRRVDPGAVDYEGALVPYRFCSDEYVGALWYCDVFDEGADAYEIVNYGTDWYRNYYIFKAFKRNRRYLDPIDYYYSIYYNVMAPIAMQYQMWISDQWWKSQEWYFLDLDGTNATENSDWNLDRHGGLAQTAAAMTGLNFLAEVIATPEPGGYGTDPDTGVKIWYTPYETPICLPGEDSAVDPCVDINIPVGEGRYAFSEFDADSGYYWYERIRVIGSFWDKVAAVETLSDPTTYFLGVDDVADFSTYILGFNVAFPHAVETLFGAIVNDDYRKFAPQLEADGTMSIPPIFEDVISAYGDQVAPDRPGPFIDPATNFTISLYALFYGMALLNANFDQSFNDGAKIWIEGSGEAFTPVSGATIATFQNPWNDRIYHGIDSPDPLSYSLGYEMVERADRLANDPVTGVVTLNCEYRDAPECYGPRFELQNLIENMEVVRGYYDLYGYSWF